jgi:hypothetical protein
LEKQNEFTGEEIGGSQRQENQEGRRRTAPQTKAPKQDQEGAGQGAPNRRVEA